jgi:hypothetical protein
MPMNPQDQIASQLNASQNSPARSSAERRAGHRHGLPDGASTSHQMARGSTADGTGSSMVCVRSLTMIAGTILIEFPFAFIGVELNPYR